MNKFGLMESETERDRNELQDFSEKIAAFPPAKPRPTINLAEVDAAAAPHGFVSREAIPLPPTHGRRRRRISVEPTRHLAMRLAVSQYDRFVAYADQRRLTYHDALAQLLDDVQGHRLKDELPE